MTDNQKKLLKFISSYRLKHGNLPTLREMVVGIEVFDNKSVLGIINKLIADGYLVKSNNKSRSVFLTEKALDFLDLPVLPAVYKKALHASDLLRLSKTFGENSVSVSLPASERVSYSDNILNSNGTNPETIRNIVENAVNYALSSHFSGSTPTLSNKNTAEEIITLLVQSLKNVRYSSKINWLAVMLIISVFCFHFFGVNAVAIRTSLIYLASIFLINKFSKESK